MGKSNYIPKFLLLYLKKNICRAFNTTSKKKANKDISIENNSLLGHYLAGIIEGDGCIIVPKNNRNEKGKLLYPVIKITFVDKDKPLAMAIQKAIDGGTLDFPKNTHYLNLLIQDIVTLKKIVILINGKMRTPKIEALHRLID